MKKRWISFKCPSCQSIVHVREKSTNSKFFYCPVCEVGEIEYNLVTTQPHAHDIHPKKPGRVLVKV